MGGGLQQAGSEVLVSSTEGKENAPQRPNNRWGGFNAAGTTSNGFLFEYMLESKRQTLVGTWRYDYNQVMTRKKRTKKNKKKSTIE